MAQVDAQQVINLLRERVNDLEYEVILLKAQLQQPAEQTIKEDDHDNS